MTRSGPCEHALDLAPARRATARGTADMYVGLSRVAWERGQLAEAADHLRAADELGEPAGLPQNPYRWRVAMAQLRAAEGDTAAALGLLEEAERVYVGDFSPTCGRSPPTRARCSPPPATWPTRWPGRAARGLAADDELSYLREYEHVTLARVLLADHAASGSRPALDEAIGLLDRLLAAAEAGGARHRDRGVGAPGTRARRSR